MAIELPMRLRASPGVQELVVEKNRGCLSNILLFGGGVLAIVGCVAFFRLVDPLVVGRTGGDLAKRHRFLQQSGLQKRVGQVVNRTGASPQTVCGRRVEVEVDKWESRHNPISRWGFVRFNDSKAERTIPMHILEKGYPKGGQSEHKCEQMIVTSGHGSVLLDNFFNKDDLVYLLGRAEHGKHSRWAMSVDRPVLRRIPISKLRPLSVPKPETSAPALEPTLWELMSDRGMFEAGAIDASRVIRVRVVSVGGGENQCGGLIPRRVSESRRVPRRVPHEHEMLTITATDPLYAIVDPWRAFCGGYITTYTEHLKELAQKTVVQEVITSSRVTLKVARTPTNLAQVATTSEQTTPLSNSVEVPTVVDKARPTPTDSVEVTTTSQHTTPAPKNSVHLAVIPEQFKVSATVTAVSDTSTPTTAVQVTAVPHQVPPTPTDSAEVTTSEQTAPASTNSVEVPTVGDKTRPTPTDSVEVTTTSKHTTPAPTNSVQLTVIPEQFKLLATVTAVSDTSTPTTAVQVTAVSHQVSPTPTDSAEVTTSEQTTPASTNSMKMINVVDQTTPNPAHLVELTRTSQQTTTAPTTTSVQAPPVPEQPTVSGTVTVVSVPAPSTPMDSAKVTKAVQTTPTPTHSVELAIASHQTTSVKVTRTPEQTTPTSVETEADTSAEVVTDSCFDSGKFEDFDSATKECVGAAACPKACGILAKALQAATVAGMAEWYLSWSVSAATAAGAEAGKLELCQDKVQVYCIVGQAGCKNLVEQLVSKKIEMPTTVAEVDSSCSGVVAN